MGYMTIAEASEKWGISVRRIQTLCSTDRIPGTTRFGSAWMIPSDAKKPADARIKTGKYIGVSARNHLLINDNCTNKKSKLG